MSDLVPVEMIANKIFLIRGQKVMLDSDLAGLYGVTTFNFNKAVKRNIGRFPEDFMFRLTSEEFKSLRFQIGMSKKGRGGRRYLPYGFTEQGVAMLSGVLNSKRAVQVNIQIMRAFVKLRQMVLTQENMLRKIEALERKFGEHDKKIALIFEALKQLLEPPLPKKTGKIGF